MDDLTATNTDQSESEKLAQIDLVTNLAEILATLLTMYNSVVNDIRKRESESNDDKLTISRLTDFNRYVKMFQKSFLHWFIVIVTWPMWEF